MGKLSSDLLARLLAGFAPWPPDVRLGPTVGEDACVLDVAAGALVVATDPITLTGSGIGRLAVTINANDVAVTGARPRWFLAAVLLPPGTTEAEVEAVFGSLHEGLAAVGAALVGGHTEVTGAVNQPVVVGQMLGLIEHGPAGEARPCSTAGARPGDVVVQVGAAPIEGAAVLAAEAADRLRDLDRATRAAAEQAADEPGTSVVEQALVAAALGATAMHDPTEGGLAGGLHELAAAAGVAVHVDRSAVVWFEPGLAVCRAIGADPWATLASGALLATFDPADAPAAVDELTAAGHPTAVIGTISTGAGVVGTDARPVVWPERDEVARILSS
ncbi:MAG: AIR synthase-related protein [Actinomycetota bacterium]|nr:AIR synthase-related protein [Actinomycetota bacterium]